MKHIPALDGLRAVAILVVLMFHSLVPSFRWGNVGVDVFFVLSGFLITGILLDEHTQTGRIQWRAFVRRRIYRLVPALLVMVGAYLVIAPFLWPGEPHFTDALWVLTYMSDYSRALIERPHYLGHTWSLSVEEHFYLLWPAILGGLAILVRKTRTPDAWWVGIFFLGWVVATGWRVASTLMWPTDFDFNYFRFDTRTSGLWLGAMVAAVARTKALEQPLSASLLAMGVLALAAGATTSRFGENNTLLYGITFAEMATALALLAILKQQEWICAPLTVPAMMWIGKVSYAIYLWHYPIQYYLRVETSKEIALFLGSALAMAIAWLSWRYVEAPMLRRRDRKMRQP